MSGNILLYIPSESDNDQSMSVYTYFDSSLAQSMEHLSVLPKKRPIPSQDFNASEPMERRFSQDRVHDPPSILHVFFKGIEHGYTDILDIECDIFKRIRSR